MSKDNDDETVVDWAAYAIAAIDHAADCYDDHHDSLNEGIIYDMDLACREITDYMYNGIDERAEEQCEDTRGALDVLWDRTLTAARAALDRLDDEVKRVHADQDQALLTAMDDDFAEHG